MPENYCSKLVLINIALKFVIIAIVLIIGVIVWRGFEHWNEQFFGIKVVLAQIGEDIKNAK